MQCCKRNTPPSGKLKSVEQLKQKDEWKLRIESFSLNENFKF